MDPAPALTTSLAVVGTNDRFLAGCWQQSEPERHGDEYREAGLRQFELADLVAALQRPQPRADGRHERGCRELADLTGTVNGTSLSSPGTAERNAVGFRQSAVTAKPLTTSTASVAIDPVLSRGIDSVTHGQLRPHHARR